MDKEQIKFFLFIMLCMIIGFIAGFIMCFLITHNYMESAKLFVENYKCNITNGVYFG